jgi:hypothetical protein
MARSARELKEENSLESEPSRASRALEYSAQPERGAAEILVAVNHLEMLISEQKAQYKRTEERLSRLIERSEQVLQQAQQLANVPKEQQEQMKDAVMSGLLEAHSIATEHALKEISEVSKQAKQEILETEKMVKAKTMRLLKITLPDKLFQVMKWLLVMTGLVIGGWFIFCVVLKL